MGSINRKELKAFTDEKNFEKMLSDYDAIKNEKDKKAFEEKYKFSMEALRRGLALKKTDELYNEIVKNNPELEGMTRAEVFSLPDFNEQLGKVNAENYDLIYGIPDNLFVERGDMDPNEWNATMRARFANAGLDWDNKEDRLKAAQKQSNSEQREDIRKNGKFRGPFEKFLDKDIEFATPRATAKIEAGQPVTNTDALIDMLRIGEVAPAGLAVPSILARNVLEGIEDDKGVMKTVGNVGKDVGEYIAGGLGLKGIFGLLGIGNKARSAKYLIDDEGSGSQLVGATKAALNGEKAGVTNPYAKEAANAVEEAALTDPQKKKFASLLDTYGKDFNKKGLERAAAESTTNKFQIGEKALNDQIAKKAESIGEEALKNTKEVKFTFENVGPRLNASQAEELNQILASRGLRDAEGNAVYTAVGGHGRNAEAARQIAENQVIMAYLKNNKNALKDVFWEEATDAVKKTYGTSKDKEFGALAKFVTETPTKYDKAFSAKGAKTAAGAAGKGAFRKYLLSNDDYDFEEK